MEAEVIWRLMLAQVVTMNCKSSPLPSSLHGPAPSYCILINPCNVANFPDNDYGFIMAYPKLTISRKYLTAHTQRPLQLARFMGPLQLARFMGPLQLARFMGPLQLARFMGPLQLARFMVSVLITELLSLDRGYNPTS